MLYETFMLQAGHKHVLPYVGQSHLYSDVAEVCRDIGTKICVPMYGCIEIVCMCTPHLRNMLLDSSFCIVPFKCTTCSMLCLSNVVFNDFVHCCIILKFLSTVYHISLLFMSL